MTLLSCCCLKCAGEKPDTDLKIFEKWYLSTKPVSAVIPSMVLSLKTNSREALETRLSLAYFWGELPSSEVNNLMKLFPDMHAIFASVSFDMSICSPVSSIFAILFIRGSIFLDGEKPVALDLVHLQCEKIFPRIRDSSLEGCIVLQNGWFDRNDHREQLQWMKDYLEWFYGTTTWS